MGKTTHEFENNAAEAATINNLLLHTFDLRFTNDEHNRKRLSEIRKGKGDSDRVQDVSDILVLCDEQADYLADCPRGEVDTAARRRELSHLLAAKGMGPESLAARKLRDGAFTLVAQTETRLRAAATYWYHGTHKIKEDAAFVAPQGPCRDSSCGYDTFRDAAQSVTSKKGGPV